MKILVTGATGFVGRQLAAHLREAGHVAVETPRSSELDIANADAVLSMVRDEQPDAIAHLAGVSNSRTTDLWEAMRVNHDGTRNVMDAVRQLKRAVPVLVTGSSEVYGNPNPDDLPLSESAPTRPRKPYAVSKLAQESVALDLGRRHDIPVVVTRSFNHIGPGERAKNVARSFAVQIRDQKLAGRREVAVGNLEIEKDFGDVRDFVRAYRLLIEGLAAGTVPTCLAVNVATGRAASVRDILEMLGSIAGIDPLPVENRDFFRDAEPPRIVGNASLLRALTGWSPEFSLRDTLRDLYVSLT